MEELQGMVTETLKKKGVLGKFKAQLRKSIISVLDTEADGSIYMENPKSASVRSTPHGTLVAELIREFNEFYDLEYTQSVFVPESNLPPQATAREDLAKQVSLSGADHSAPLLTQIIAQYLQGSAAASADNRKKPPPLTDHDAISPHLGSSTFSTPQDDEDDPYADEGFDNEDTQETPTKPVDTPTKSPTGKSEADKDSEVSFSDHSASDGEVATVTSKYHYVEDVAPPAQHLDDERAKDAAGEDYSDDSDRF
mmetsp:Transcript_106752/g.184141  ORF Transcript_106752/g.184141 Transcript_106752/m.184141 type:complete len:253 (-) Transcript_106752:419-1177(-)